MLQLGFTPYAHQREAHYSRKRFTVLVWHRRAGKTVFACMELLLAALTASRQRSRFGYVAPLLKQGKKAAWDYLKAYTQNIPGRAVNESELSIRFPNSATVSLYGADNPDSLRGDYFDGVVLDEVADMKPEVWGSIIRPMLTDRMGWALFIGTPKGVNLFSKTYYEALKSPEDWHADMRRASDTKVIPASEIEQARREMSEAQFAQEFDCDFAAAVSNALIPLPAVLEAQRRMVSRPEFEYAPKIMGVDVARYGDDANAIARRQGPLLMPMQVFRGLDSMEVAATIARSATEWKPDAMMVDGGGVGGPVIDRLRQLGWNVIEVQFGGKPNDLRFADKRMEMWSEMGLWLKTASLPPDDNELVGELTAPTYTFADRNGKQRLESKDDMRARGLPSPDRGDAIACTFAEPVRPATQFGERSLYAPSQVQTDFDPWSVLRGG